MLNPLTPTTDNAEVEFNRIVQRPDGFYWFAEDGQRESGPFATYDEAAADMKSADGSELEPGETLQEAEAEIGIADWIDPDTHEPSEEERPRLEDH